DPQGRQPKITQACSIIFLVGDPQYTAAINAAAWRAMKIMVGATNADERKIAEWQAEVDNMHRFEELRWVNVDKIPDGVEKHFDGEIYSVVIRAPKLDMFTDIAST